MGKSKFLILAALLLAVVAVSSVGTYAAYTTSSSGNAQVTAAHFSFRLNGATSETHDLGTIELTPGDTDDSMKLVIDTSGTAVHVRVNVDVTAKGTMPYGMKIQVGNDIVGVKDITMDTPDQTANIIYPGDLGNSQSHEVPIVVSWILTDEELESKFPYTGSAYNYPVSLEATVTVMQVSDSEAASVSRGDTVSNQDAAAFTPINSFDEESMFEDEMLG